jgi:hypothetical protein
VARKPRRAARSATDETPKNPEPVSETDLPIQSRWKRYSYAWLTLGLFAFSILGHWIFGWYAYVNEQQALSQPVDVGGYTIEMLRDTFENWQSEFLQLLWQVGGLALFLYVGSPQSKEGNDRLEAKVDVLLRKIDPRNAEEEIQALDRAYAGAHQHSGRMRGRRR